MKKLIDQLRDEGYKGFVTIEELLAKPGIVSKVPGVYLVIYLGDDKPLFCEVGTGGFFKGKNPNVSIQELNSNWIDGEHIVYIGKATELCRRLRQYMSFGQGKNIGHWGGRYIWQIKESRNLIICWKATDIVPRDVEKEMIEIFKVEHHGKRPFANLQD